MVPGEGPQPAPGMIVGEAPGANEMEQGRPFVGRAGRELDGVLRALGIDRTTVYVTNVVKERPVNEEGKTRAPYDAEVEAWLSILHGEIEHTAPVAILALGKTAARAITDFPLPEGSKVGNVYTAWHPAYILRRPGLREEWLEQIRPWAEALGAYEYPS